MKRFGGVVLLGAVLLAGCSNGVQSTAGDAEGSRAVSTTVSTQYGSISYSPYTLYNNEWGMVSGSRQSLTATSASSWYVSALQPYSTGGIKAYPSVSRTAANLPASSVTCSATAQTTTPTSGVWDQAYDVWVKGSSQNVNTSAAVTNEIMLWTNWTQGTMYPISDLYVYDSASAKWIPGAFVNSVTVGGQTWNLYVGNNGANAVYSFLAVSKTNSNTVDIGAILRWLQTQTNPNDYTSAAYAAANGWKDSFIADQGKAYLPSDAFLFQYQYGWEIVSTTPLASKSSKAATLQFSTTAFSSTVQ